jgi:prepilin-type N-terminal cleavage/methylation domain-containing protein
MRSGFSLAESLIALMILSVALLAMALVPVATTKLLADTAQREEAGALALSWLEEIEGIAFDALPLASSDVIGGYIRTVTVTKDDDIADVTVTVTWQGATGTQSVTQRRKVSPSAVPAL